MNNYFNTIFPSAKRLRNAFAVIFAVAASCNMAMADNDKPLKLVSKPDTVICGHGQISFDVKIKLNKAENCEVPCTTIINGKEIKTENIKVEAGKLDNNGYGKSVSLQVPEEADVKNDPEGKHVVYQYVLGLRHDDFETVHRNLDTLTVHVWGIPKAEIISPVSDDICGYTHTLEADGRWSDISSYHWSAGANIDLENKDERIATMKLNTQSERSETIYLVETTGPDGLCKSEDSRTFNFKKAPKGSIVLNDDEETGLEAQYICSALTDDPAFEFLGDVTLEGNGPFAVTLSNGEKYTDLPIGTTSQTIHSRVAGDITIKLISDKNGCETHEDGISGTITVIDRKPIITAPVDTAEIEGREVMISRVMSDMGTTFRYEVAEIFHRHYNSKVKVDNIISKERTRLNGNSAEYYFSTNKTGLLAIDYTEINQMEDHKDCEVTIRQYVNTYAPVNAPNGFSPNIDGKNDYLVIQGIPDENHVAVYDPKGKIVFEQDNYRNDWNAEGLEDGYYVYIFEGDGIKTTKATLVIKRNKK